MSQSTTRADNSNGVAFLFSPIPSLSIPFSADSREIQRAMTTADLKDIPSYAAAAVAEFLSSPSS